MEVEWGSGSFQPREVLSDGTPQSSADAQGLETDGSRGAQALVCKHSPPWVGGGGLGVVVWLLGWGGAQDGRVMATVRRYLLTLGPWTGSHICSHNHVSPASAQSSNFEFSKTGFLEELSSLPACLPAFFLLSSFPAFTPFLPSLPSFLFPFPP